MLSFPHMLFISLHISTLTQFHVVFTLWHIHLSVDLSPPCDPHILPSTHAHLPFGPLSLDLQPHGMSATIHVSRAIFNLMLSQVPLATTLLSFNSISSLNRRHVAGNKSQFASQDNFRWSAVKLNFDTLSFSYSLCLPPFPGLTRGCHHA